MRTFYFKLRAVRESTMTEVRRFEYRTGTCKYTEAANAIEQFRDSLGAGWVVFGEIVTRQYFEQIIACEFRQEVLLLRGVGGV